MAGNRSPRYQRSVCALRNPTPPNPQQLEINRPQNTDLDERNPYMPFVWQEEVGKWNIILRYLGRYLVPRAVPRFSAGPTTSLGATTWVNADVTSAPPPCFSYIGTKPATSPDACTSPLLNRLSFLPPHLPPLPLHRCSHPTVCGTSAPRSGRRRWSTPRRA